MLISDGKKENSSFNVSKSVQIRELVLLVKKRKMLEEKIMDINSQIDNVISNINKDEQIISLGFKKKDN